MMYSKRTCDRQYIYNKLGKRCSICGEIRYSTYTQVRNKETGDYNTKELFKMCKEDLNNVVDQWELICIYCKRKQKRS